MCFWTGVGGNLQLWQYFIITLYSAIAVSKMLMITLLEVSMFPYAKKYKNNKQAMLQLRTIKCLYILSVYSIFPSVPVT